MKNKDTGFICLPADFSIENLEKYAVLNKKYSDFQIKEVYGSLAESPFGSGRTKMSIPVVTWNNFVDYIKKCNDFGIEFNYTFNALTLGNAEFVDERRDQMLNFIKKLYEAGIRSFTVTLPSLISLIADNFPDAKISVSIINAITSVGQIKGYANFGKISKVYIKEDLNRNIEKIKKISKKSPVPLGVIVNTFCILECPYKVHHYNFISQRETNDSIKIREYYGAFCAKIKCGDLTEIIKMPWIRPSDIKKYKDAGVKYFKISGREMIKYGADFPRAAEAYMSGSYNGDLISLFMNFSDIPYVKIFSLESDDMDDFFKFIFSKKDGCERDLCEECGFCEEFKEKVKYNKQATSLLPEFKRIGRK